MTDERNEAEEPGEPQRPDGAADDGWDVVPPAPASSTPPEAAPQAPHDAPPAPAQPPTADDAPQAPQAPPAAPPPLHAPGAPPKRGPGMGAGFGIGCAAYGLGIPIMLASLSVTAAGGFLGVLWPFILIAVVSGLLMIPEKTRRVGAGMLIASAAAWIVVIGPCIALLYNMG